MMRLGARPGARPSRLPDARLGARPGRLLDARLGARPGRLLDARLGARPGARLGARPGRRPGARLDARPGRRPGARLLVLSGVLLGARLLVLSGVLLGALSGFGLTLGGCDEGSSDGPPPVQTVEHAPFVTAGGLPAETAWDEASRAAQPLSGEAGPQWYFRFDASHIGEQARWFDLTAPTADWTPIAVPAAWDLAHPEGFDRQEVGWYLTTFALDGPLGESVRLRFDGVFREARVWLNGQELGGTDLPYLPFGFEVTDALVADGDNVLVVRVDNRITETSLPCDTVLHRGKHGWFPYGGILRPVRLEGGLGVWPGQVLIRPRLSPDAARARRGELEVDVYFTRARQSTAPATAPAQVTARVRREGAPAPLHEWEPAEVPAEAATAGQVPGLRFSVTLPAPVVYSPAHPEHVYRLELTVEGLERPAVDTAPERWSYRFAFRTFEALDQRFWLNGEDFYLRGINRHEDHPTLGPLYDADQVAEDLQLIGELGANFSRPGHYPNDVRVLRAFEDRGVLLAEEIPVYQWDHGQMADPAMVDRAERALRAMILRDHNRPAIVMWSVANEIHSWAQTAPAFVRTLYEAAKALDPARPVMVAAVSAPVMSEMDESSGEVDVVGINEYQGWYVETTDTVTDWLETLHGLFADRTVFISEYGAGALRGRHLERSPGEEPVDDHSYSEEYQAWFHDQHISQFRALPWVRGFMPWVLADFRMQWTPTTGQPHPVERMNLKGLCDENRLKKQAFETVRQHFTEIAASP